MKSGWRGSPTPGRNSPQEPAAFASPAGASSNPVWNPRTRTSSRHRKSCWSRRSYRHTATLANAFGPPSGRRRHRVMSHPSARVRALWFRLSVGTAPLSTRARAFSNVSAAGGRHARAVRPYRHLFLGAGEAMGDRSATTPRLQVVFVGPPASLEVPAEDYPARGPEAHRFPERRGGLVRREDLQVHAVDGPPLRPPQGAGREGATHALPPQRGVHEEVVHDEDPPELRGRRVHREGHADDGPLLPGAGGEGRERGP